MYKHFIFLCIFLSGCIEKVEIPVQINPFACIDGWQYDFKGSAILDNEGAQKTCEVSND